MMEVVKVLAWAAAAAVGIYITFSQQIASHDYRLGRLEAGFESHLVRHETQNDEIQKRLLGIQVDLARLANGGGQDQPGQAGYGTATARAVQR